MSRDIVRRRPSASLDRATDRAIQVERSRAEIQIERVLAVSDVVDASLISLGRTAHVRAAVELAQPSAAPFAELLLTAQAAAYAGIITDTARRR